MRAGSASGGTEGGRWVHLQSDMHMVGARLGCKSTLVGRRCANSCLGCMDRLTKHYSHLVGGSFLACALSGCLTSKNANCCILVNEWVWLRSLICLLGLEVELGSVL